MSDIRITRRDFAAMTAVVGATAPPSTAIMPSGTIGGIAISRLILGSNPMGGGAPIRAI